jgi:hypothetical protein
MQTEPCFFLDDAINDWNDRPIEDVLQARIDEQAKVSEKLKSTIASMSEVIGSYAQVMMDELYRMEKEALGE